VPDILKACRLEIQKVAYRSSLNQPNITLKAKNEVRRKCMQFVGRLIPMWKMITIILYLNMFGFTTKQAQLQIFFFQIISSCKKIVKLLEKSGNLKARKFELASKFCYILQNCSCSLKLALEFT
jgi:hypothetical protein